MSERGTCSECGYRYALRKDGTVQAHRIYYGPTAVYCDGAGKLPSPPTSDSEAAK